ncbi:hypothetical protein BH10BAC3_BH10BAC3_10110 [soil metagenome]
MIKIKEADVFARKILNGSGLQIVRFCAEWSGPCQIMSTIYKEMHSMFKTTASFYLIDIDESPLLKEKLGVTDLPTILFYRNGVIIDFITGLISRELFIAKLESAIK